LREKSNSFLHLFQQTESLAQQAWVHFPGPIA
jgi:hypothetical protein